MRRRRRRTRRFPAFVVIAVAIIAAALMAAFASSHADTEKATVTIKTTPPMEVAPLNAERVDKPEAAAVTPPASTHSPSPSPSPAPKPDETDVEMLAQMIWGEARGIASDMEKAACVWCVLNRVDDPAFPDSVAAVLTQPHQFAGYSPDYPATEEHKAIAADVLTRWMEEQAGAADVGHVLPAEYLFFTGDGEHNIFTDEWRGGATWDWGLKNQYKN